MYSLMNVSIYQNYNDEVYKEALIDWGFFGDETLRPSWMQKPTIGS